MDDAEALDRFEVRARCSPTLIDKALEGIGRREGEDHARISQNWLRSQGLSDAKWRESFEAAIGYAAARGWVDAQGAIRAHIAK